MNRHISIQAVLGTAVTTALFLFVGSIADTGAQAPLGIDSARITISGTSNIHAYTASTTTVRVTRGQFSDGLHGPELWANALKPGAVEAFEVVVPAATLTSPKEGLDKNMHKALQVGQHAEISFRLLRIEESPTTPGAGLGIGVLRVAGVEREVTFDLVTERKGPALSVQGKVQLLMTDFGIKPPTAMLGMLKTDPKVTVTFEAVLSSPTT